MALKELADWCEDCKEIDIPDNRTGINLILQALCAIVEAGPGGGGGDVSVTVVSKEVTTDALTMSGETLDLDVDQAASLAIAVSGSFTGTATFMGSLDGTTFDTTLLWGKDINGQPISTFTAPGTYFFNVAVFNEVRLIVTTPGTGTANLVIAMSSVPLG